MKRSRLIPAWLRGMSLENRLKELNLFSLEQRRIRRGAEVCKILKGVDKVNTNEYSEAQLRIQVPCTGGHVVDAESLGSFKTQFDKVN